MACGCNKLNESTPSTAQIVGNVNGNSPIKYKLQINLFGLKWGDPVWLTGTGIQQLLDAGYIS